MSRNGACLGMGRHRFFLSPLLDNLRWPWYASGMENQSLLVDGLHGIGVPLRFARLYGDLAVAKANVKQADVDVLLCGPYAPDYWEAWDDVLRAFRYVSTDGRVHFLEQDGDLWLVAEA